MARATMANLISDLRGKVAAGTADYTVGVTAYWTDDQLQAALDEHQVIVDFEPLDYFGQRAGSVYEYKIYSISLPNWEGTPTMMDSNGASISGTAFTWDYKIGRATFGADQGGSARLVSGTIYDLNAAAADVWKEKADYYAGAYDVATDNHSLKRSQLYDHALKQHQRYAALSGFGGASITPVRGDM